MNQEVASSYNEELLEAPEDLEHATSSRKVALSALLGALSIVLAGTASFIPRIPGWGIAIFDPVSIVWVIAFLIGGIEVALITTFAGFFGLFLFDPTGIGPVFKLLATLPMIVVPWLSLRFSRNKVGSIALSNPRHYAGSMFIGFLVRLAIMLPLNLVIVPLLYGISDVTFIITYVVILNVIQSFWDALVPYLIVFKTRVWSGLSEHFRLW